MGKNLREFSRVNYCTESEHPTDQEIQSGCLQRSADALEKLVLQLDWLVKDRVEMERKLKNSEERGDYYRDKANTLEKQLSHQKGLTTKAKNKLKVVQASPVKE